MSNYSNPDGQDMDDMNELRARHDLEEKLYQECLRHLDDNDVFRPIATSHHIKILLRRIYKLEQSLLREVNENQEPF